MNDPVPALRRLSAGESGSGQRRSGTEASGPLPGSDPAVRQYIGIGGGIIIPGGGGIIGPIGGPIGRTA